MNIALLKESKKNEFRVALVPDQVGMLTQAGHVVRIQKGAGTAIGYTDALYKKAGAKIESSVSKLIKQSHLVIKVKEPTPAELGFMREGQILFCYLHLAAFPHLTKLILKKKITALGYETLQMPDGSLPLLKPMSEIAGKLATQNGAHFLKITEGGSGVLLGGTQEVGPATVVILGGGVVGLSAAKIAMGMGANTIVLEANPAKCEFLKKQYEALYVYPATPENIVLYVPQADLLVGAVLVPGAKAPKLVNKKLVQKMKKGSVVVDVAVDQGGCIETSQVTTHEKPIINKFGILHYGVANMPGSVPVTATQALSTATFPYIELISSQGLEKAIEKKPELKGAINCAAGRIVHPGLK
ncbi:alanine dehydrogenase [bacterium]|nr:alanine dehydrogenase [bacterium]